ncbi:ribosome maturation factor RimP [Pseudomarimonas salicorniae]|uniref:Ribosome maturation factor RimP n=1 Tax=Pseudomarimonas salicorniae TaxID=2933270 RepID=A0ABT0GFH2_9GAMM|nr:ribosome maturation factor RimP [Lysobacter sp. CAU 1642]MCK7593289.1 ribosome maturation factor RimP [Lysobacter sp. CAU 1642]
MSNRVEQLGNLLGPAIADLGGGLFLWGIEFVPGASQSLLRIYVDVEGRHVGIEDCETVSREISALLDIHDPIPGNYNLEVSSPGMDRPLFEAAHYARFLGEQAKLALLVPVEGRRRLNGRIARVEGEAVTIADESGEFTVQVGNVQKARLVPQFDQAEKKPPRQRRGKNTPAGEAGPEE